jgi:hypothetical protein
LSQGLGLGLVVNRFNVVSVRTNDESCIVVRVVLRAQTRRTIVFATRLLELPRFRNRINSTSLVAVLCGRCLVILAGAALLLALPAAALDEAAVKRKPVALAGATRPSLLHWPGRCLRAILGAS